VVWRKEVVDMVPILSLDMWRVIWVLSAMLLVFAVAEVVDDVI